MTAMKSIASGLLAAVLTMSAQAVAQVDLVPDRGRLLTTAGVSSVEGAAGGGLAPWAVIAGHGSPSSWGANAFYTQVSLPDYDMRARGAAIGVANRVEVSVAEHRFDLNERGADLGLGDDFSFEQIAYGAKVRLFGHLIADQGTLMPQVAVGVQHKRARRGALLEAIGAGDDEGTEFTLSATKLFLAQSVLLNVGARYTNANQFGLMGFGGDREDDKTLQGEFSVAYLVSRRLAVGAEMRTKPDNISFAREDDAYDIFGAWFPSKHLSVTAAYADLGSIGGVGGQRGAYISLQTGF